MKPIAGDDVGKVIMLCAYLEAGGNEKAKWCNLLGDALSMSVSVVATKVKSMGARAFLDTLRASGLLLDGGQGDGQSSSVGLTVEHGHMADDSNG